MTATHSEAAKMFLDTLNCARRLTGAQLCVTQRPPGLQRLLRLTFGTENLLHYLPYCRLCQQLENKNLCTREHSDQIPARCMEHSAPFLNHCYAGVLEAVIPITYGDRPEAILLLSGCRTQEAAMSEQVHAIAQRLSAQGEAPSAVYSAYNALAPVQEDTLLDTACMAQLCIHAILQAYELSAGEAPADAHHFVAEAMAYILASSGDAELSVLSVAKRLGITREYLSRLFRREMGTSVQAYIRQVRMQRACLLLSNTGMSMRDVAASIGLSDPNYLSRVFRQSMGMTPGQYRSDLRGISVEV